MGLFGQSEYIPEYAFAADTHQVANGKESVIDGAVDESIDFGKFAVSAIARAVTSTINTVPAVANLFGGDFEELKTDSVLRMFDDDLTAYYLQNQETVDVWGDVAAMFVPGMAGIKGVNMVQKGLAAAARGEGIGANLARSFGTLPEQGSKYAKIAADEMQKTGGMFRLQDANVAKAFAANYGQMFIEGAAFETAAAASMTNSPLFENHDVTDIVKNAAFGGGLFGAGIVGSVTAAQTYGQLKRASDAISKSLNPMRHAAATEVGTDPWAQLLWTHNQKMNAPVPTASVDDIALYNTQRRAADRRARDLTNLETELFTKLSNGDADVARIMQRALDTAHPDAPFKALMGAEEIVRLGTVSDAEIAILNGIKTGKPVGKSVKYVDTATNEVFHTAPAAIGLADTVTSAKEFEKEVKRLVGNQPIQGGNFNPIQSDILNVEARYVAASRDTAINRAPIGEYDLPYLEAAYNQGLSSVNVAGVQMDTQMLKDHIINVKKKLADDLADAIAMDPTMSVEKAAKLLNVDKRVLRGEGYPINSQDHFFAKKEFTADPEYVKIAYNTEKMGVDGNVLSGMTAIKQMQKQQQIVNDQAAALVFGDDAEKLVRLGTDDVLSALASGSGAKALMSASSEYGTIGSKVEWLGKVLADAELKLGTKISDTFQPLMHAALNNVDALNEIYVLRQAVLQTGEKYVLNNGEMVLKSVRDYELKVGAGKQAIEPVIPPNVPERIPINTQEAWEFMVGMTEHNATHLMKEKVLRNAKGKDIGDWQDVVYFPQPTSKEFPYFSFVKPKNPWAGEQTQMLWARSAEELQKLEAAVPHEYNIYRKADTDEFYRIRKEYDADLGMNSRSIISDMRRKGVAAPFIPETNGQELFEQILGHYKQQGQRQLRDAAELYNNVAFQELRFMDKEYKSLYGAKKPGTGESSYSTPYESYIKTALNIPRNASLPVWTELNNLAENIVSKIANSFKAGGMKPKTDAEMDAINAGFDQAGIRGVKDALTEMVANHPADKKVLSRWVQNANALFSTLVLRTDPMNALNNGVGAVVLGGSELNYLMRSIKGKGGEEAAGFLRELGELKLPGTDAYIKSPTKLVSAAYSDFFKYLSGDAEAVAKFEKFNRNGWMPQMMEQLRSSLDAMTLRGMKNAGEISSKAAKAAEATGNFLEKATGNKLAETMNRYVAAHIADSIASVGVKYGVLGEKEANAFINTFVNRTQGNYTASQRPLMFQGPIGHSISLFMTYQFNMMQHIFRHLSSDGGRSNAVMLMGLQSSVYGLNGLPAFNLMNQHLVGQASGNRTHADVYSAGMDIPAVGEWLLYGGLSNATGLGVYSRGDLNPRHATIIPNSFGDIPVVSATTKFFSQMMKSGEEIAAGANPTSTFLRGIEHAGISRPLAGLAQVLNAVERDDDVLYSTSTKGNVLYAQDLYSLASLGRIAGARPLDEAITRDAYYRVQVYEAKDKEHIHTIGAAIRDKVNSKSEITNEDLEGFMSRYVEYGGSQKNFIKFYQSQVKAAGKNQIQKMVERGNSSYGQYMQNLTRSLDSDPISLEN